MQDGRIPKDIMYGELTSGTRPTGKPALRYKDVCKRDLKAGSLNPADLEAATTDHVSWRLAVRTSVKLSEGRERTSGKRRGSAGGREQSQCPQKQSQASPVATATDSASLILDCLATKIPQKTDSGADTPLSPETEECQRYVLTGTCGRGRNRTPQYETWMNRQEIAGETGHMRSENTIQERTQDVGKQEG